MEKIMKNKILIALGLVLTIGLVGVAGTVGVAAAEGEALNGQLCHGHILEINGDTLLLQTRRGLVTLLTDEHTRYRMPGVQEPNLNGLAVGDHIAVAGRRTEDRTGLARLIVRIPSRQEVGQLRGQLTGIDGEKLTITRPDGVEITVVTNPNTRYHVLETENPDLQHLNIGDNVFARGLWDQNIHLQAQIVGLVPKEVEQTLTGRVLAVQHSSLEILTRQGPFTIITQADTRFRIPNVENPTLNDLTVDAILAAGGTLQADGLHAVVVAVTPQRPQPATRRGLVTAIGDDTLTLATPNGPVTIHTDEHTRFRVAGVENAALADIQIGYQALVVGRQNDDGDIQARGIGARPAPAQE
jgi:hypothetical protein